MPSDSQGCVLMAPGGDPVVQYSLSWVLGGREGDGLILSGRFREMSGSRWWEMNIFRISSGGCVSTSVYVARGRKPGFCSTWVGMWFPTGRGEDGFL